MSLLSGLHMAEDVSNGALTDTWRHRRKILGDFWGAWREVKDAVIYGTTLTPGTTALSQLILRGTVTLVSIVGGVLCAG